jgi:hypothetical protein
MGPRNAFSLKDLLVLGYGGKAVRRRQFEAFLAMDLDTIAARDAQQAVYGPESSRRQRKEHSLHFRDFSLLPGGSFLLLKNIKETIWYLIHPTWAV